MKRLLIWMALGAPLLWSVPAYAAPASANVTAGIQQDITLTKDAGTPTGGDLMFGTIAADAAGGTVVIDPATSGRTSPSLTLLPGTYGPAAFTATGAPNQVFWISLPSGTLYISNGMASMGVFPWTTNIAGQPRFSAAGSASFNVGGTITVQPNQSPGFYTGVFQVTVLYN